jgi:hypothetical protein
VARRRASDVSDGWREGARFVLGSVKFRTRQAATLESVNEIHAFGLLYYMTNAGPGTRREKGK